MTHRLSIALAGPSLAVLLALGASPALARGTKPAVYTGTYSGKITGTVSEPPAPGNAGEQIEESLTWSVTVTDRYRHNKLVGGTATETAHGTETYVAGTTSAGCTATQAVSSPSVKRAGFTVGPAVVRNNRPIGIQGGGVIPSLTYQDASSGFCIMLDAPDQWAEGECAVFPDSDQTRSFEDIVEGAEVDKLRRGAYHASQPYSASETGSAPCYGSTETLTRSASASLTIHGPRGHNKPKRHTHKKHRRHRPSGEWRGSRRWSSGDVGLWWRSVVDGAA